MFEFRVAAETVTAELARPLRVELAALAKLLVVDLQVRNGNAAATVKHLRDSGMPLEDLTFSIYWSQFWDACGADEEAQELDDLREEAIHQLMTETTRSVAANSRRHAIKPTPRTSADGMSCSGVSRPGPP